jgi:hypothetical protein
LSQENGRKNAKPEAARNLVWRNYKASAEFRSLEFSLTPKQFDKLIVGCCFYCGEEPQYEAVSFAGNIFKYNGIDRVDSSKGYFKKNCVPCCRICNLMKRATPLHEFIEQIRKIAEYTESLPCTR